MNMEAVVKVRGVVCPKVGEFIRMYGRKKRLYVKSSKLVENHVLSGKWKSIKAW